MKIEKLRFLVAAGLATLLAAPQPAQASQEACLFTAGELAALIGQPLREPEVSPPKPPYSLYCTFEAASAPGKKLIVSVRARETQQEFNALQRLARMTNKAAFSELKDVGRGAYAAPHGLRVWDGTRAVYVSGLTGILKREITPAEASAFLRLGLERLASHADAGPIAEPGATSLRAEGGAAGEEDRREDRGPQLEEAAGGPAGGGDEQRPDPVPGSALSAGREAGVAGNVQ